jgi:hypothetical protein
MKITFNIKLPNPLPNEAFAFAEEELLDEDARWLRIKEVMESYKELIEEEIPGTKIEIEW